MKVGVLTFHFAHNYGAVLQCFALARHLESRGHETFVINHTIEHITQNYKWFNIHRIVRKNIFEGLKEIFLLSRRRKRWAQFNHFFSRAFSFREESDISDLSYVVVGSDQVWNTSITSGFDRFYWGNASEITNARKISYAASMGRALETIDKKRMLSLLDNFAAISVREKDLAYYLKYANFEKEVYVVPDPTLLLNKCQWNSVAKTTLVPETYVLVYQVRVSEKTDAIAKEIAKKNGKKIIYLSPNVAQKQSPETLDASPEVFLGLIKNAAFIVTSSFHGTVFSAIFEKKFLCVKLNDGCDSRSQTLLESLGLEGRFVESFDDYEERDVDWELVRQKILILQKNADDFLSKCGL